MKKVFKAILIVGIVVIIVIVVAVFLLLCKLNGIDIFKIAKRW